MQLILIAGGGGGEWALEISGRSCPLDCCLLVSGSSSGALSGAKMLCHILSFVALMTYSRLCNSLYEKFP